ncbi:MAG: DUF1330 domain-containing protein [Saprospiraceae bacterium]
MIYLTQIIYIHPTAESSFNEFESIVIPSMTKYGGTMMLRVRPTPDGVIQHSIEIPYEIHIVSFETESGLTSYMQDPERKKFLYLKDQSVKVSYIYKGVQL